MEQEQELRIFHFGHFMLSSIQQGIQAAHAQTEMAVAYLGGGVVSELGGGRAEINMYREWAEEHKTIVCKNGGNSEALARIHDTIFREDATFPRSSFDESEDALNGTLTNVAIVLPERIFKIGVKVIKNGTYECKYHDNGVLYHFYDLNDDPHKFTDYEHEVIKILASTRLAS